MLPIEVTSAESVKLFFSKPGKTFRNKNKHKKYNLKKFQSVYSKKLLFCCDDEMWKHERKKNTDMTLSKPSWSFSSEENIVGDGKVEETMKHPRLSTFLQAAQLSALVRGLRD